MPLPSSGQISLSHIQVEFGGANPISLSEYYGAASGVPTSGAISLSDFYGKSAWNGAFGGAQPYSSSQSSSFYSEVFAAIRFETNGNIYRDGTQTGSQLIGTWDNNGAINGSNTEVRFVVTTSGGAVANGASSFVALTLNRTISVTTNPMANPAACSGRIEIRPAGGGTILTADFNMVAHYTGGGGGPI